MRQPARTRRVMFDIGAAGPWAGVMLAIPAVIIGLYLSDVTPLDKSAGGLELGNSLLFLGLSHLVLGVDPSTVNVNLNPIAFAGWLGLFVTIAEPAASRAARRRPRNLRAVPPPPSHDLDALRHLVRADGAGAARARDKLLGRMAAMGGAVDRLGLGHPSTIDRDTPLNPRRALAAWATVALFIVTFSPVPLAFVPPEAPMPTPENSHSQEIIHHMPHYDHMLRQLGRVKI